MARLNRGVVVELGVEGDRANKAEIENAPVDINNQFAVF